MRRNDVSLESILAALEEGLETSQYVSGKNGVVSFMYASNVKFSDYLQFHNVKRQLLVRVDFFEFRELALCYEEDDFRVRVSVRFPALSEGQKWILTNAILVWVGCGKYKGDTMILGSVVIRNDMEFAAFIEAALKWLNNEFAGRGLVFITE